MREVCAGGEDILLRGGRVKGTAMQLARAGSRNSPNKNASFSKNLKKIGRFINRG